MTKLLSYHNDVIAKDTITAVPDMVFLMEPFDETKRQCRKIDDAIGRPR